MTKLTFDDVRNFCSQSDIDMLRKGVQWNWNVLETMTKNIQNMENTDEKHH